jgi:tight adherence protein B
VIGTIEVLFVIAAAFAAYLYVGVRARRRSLSRLDAAIGHLTREIPGNAAVVRGAIEDIRRESGLRPFPRRYQWAAIAAGVAVFAGMYFVVHLRWELAAAIGFLSGVCAWLGDEYAAERRIALIEAQLSEAIDMLVSSLRVGAALLVAFESALKESRAPLRPYLQEIVGRFRLGDDPRVVVGELPERIPLETFRLFALSMAVHWDVGGSVAATLATVGRTIRDRIEMARRVRAQAVESHLSVVVVMGIAYALAYLMWRANPERLSAFVSTEIGVNLVALVIALQGVGLIWMGRISRSTF